MILLLLLFGVIQSTTIPFSTENALQMWRINSLSYCNEEIINALSCQECIQFRGLLSNVSVIDNPLFDLQGFVGLWENKDLMIVFRASESTLNLIENLASPVLAHFDVCEKCMASGTYLSLYASIRDQVFKKVIRLLQTHPDAEMHFSGHSLGGVFVTLIAIDVLANLNYYDFNLYLQNSTLYSESINHNIQVAEVYTFGMPRIGNSYLADFIHQRIPHFYRITHGKDVVPLLPPLFMEFQHTGDEYWFTTDEHVRVCPYPESSSCINSIRTITIQDHSDYMGEVKRKCIWSFC